MRLLQYLVLFLFLPVHQVLTQDHVAVINDGYGEFVYVPAGEFRMGDNFNEGGADERPVHTVYVDVFYIGRYEVTNGEYAKFIADGGYAVEAYWSASEFGKFGTAPAHWKSTVFRGGGIAGNEQDPVVGVSWLEARAYCAWLSAKTGRTYRLPTEAEWEKAARGTDQRRYPWGSAIDSAYANFFDKNTLSNNGPKPAGWYDGSTRGLMQTHRNASPYGALDMSGNVWEWCADWHDSRYYAGLPSPANNPAGPSTGLTRVVRGGGWDYNAGQPLSLRAALRMSYNPTGRYAGVGFRCVRTP